MFRFRIAINSISTIEGILPLMLLAIFVTELTVMATISPLLSRLGLYYSSLLDAIILVLVYALPLWYFLVQPRRKYPAGTRPPVFSKLLFLAILAGIFLAEFLIMMALPSIMPQSAANTIKLTDASITTLLSAPFLLWFTRSAKKSRKQIHTDDLLADPLRLYFVLLFMVFLTDLLMDVLNPYIFPYVSQTLFVIFDAILSTLLLAPLLWWFLVKPLMRNTLSLKARANAIYSQAVDAIITLDAQGVIDSVNPAAESIFGYAADELTGRPGTLLFDGNRQDLYGLLTGANQSASDEGKIVSFETSGRCHDGAIITLDVSISRILLEGEQEYLMIMRDISSRKKLEKEIKESEERLSLAITGSNDGIWDWDIVTNTLYYTPRFNELLGYGADELEPSFATFEKLLHPQDSSRVMKAIHDHLEGDSPYDIEYRLRSKAGYYRWYSARGKVARDDSGRPVRMAGSISDINTQKEAIEALRESEVRFRQVFEQSEDAIIFFKPHSCSVIDVNVTAIRLFGYTKAELQEDGLKLLTRAEDFDYLANAINSIRQERMALLDKVVNVRKDGTELIVSIRGKVMTLQGVDVIYCTFRDVTERLRLEKEARDVQSKLIQANKMTSLGLLVSGVAHEINNPNNFIMANSQLLERSWADALKILREYYRENGEFFIGGVPFSELEAHSPRLFAGIIDGSRRIDSIVSNLKGFARNDGSIASSDVNVNQVAAAAVSILHYELNKFTDNFHVELGENIPLIRGNSQQLGQIIINLLMNACQALPDRARGIWLATVFDAAAAQVIISVLDEGIGMAPEKSRLIMDPFFTTKLDSGGTGLGLSICQSIVKDHSWAMDFSSQEGQGSTFVVRIPVGATAQKEQSA